MEYHSSGSLPLLGRPRYCPGANANANSNTANGNGASAGGANANGGYLCETGHCCGESGCCTYYYELWWFWLLWSGLILFSCCCAYRHRRAKLRVQQQQRQTDISLLAYHGAAAYPASMLDLSFLASLKLPSYEEIATQPSTPPPPYSSVYTTSPRYAQPPAAPAPHLLTHHQPPPLHRPCVDMLSSLSSDNSSSCSCDSCCPSSPCSSSLSVAVTYETDTSHASTPCGAPPLPLHVTMETIATEVGLEAVMLAGAVAVATPVGGDENDVIAARSLVDGPLFAAETAGRSDHAPCSEGLPAQSPDHTPKHTPSPDSNHTHNIGLNLNHGPTLNTTPDLSPTPNLDPVPIVSPSSDPSPSPDKSPTPHANPAPGHGEGFSSDSAPVSRSCKTSLSPSPRPSPSPPKQTLFSPCVDVYEAGPPSWGAGPGGEEEGEDVGADESQYRQRRLTGDSGIEVCRCRMEEEEEEEEEEMEEEEVDGGGGGKDLQKKGGEGGRGGSDVSALHDSDDCPARALGAATPCSPAPNANPVAAATPTPTPLKEPGEVIVVVETV